MPEISESLAIEKLQTLAENEGYDESMQLVEENVVSSAPAGICVVDGCEYSTNVEPDQRQGYCESCGTNTVVSLIELWLEAGLE